MSSFDRAVGELPVCAVVRPIEAKSVQFIIRHWMSKCLMLLYHTGNDTESIKAIFPFYTFGGNQILKILFFFCSLNYIVENVKMSQCKHFSKVTIYVSLEFCSFGYAVIHSVNQVVAG